MMRVTNEGVLAEVHEIRADIAKVETLIKEMNGRQRSDHDRITCIEQKVSIWAGTQVALTVIASSVAAWLGMRR